MVGSKDSYVPDVDFEAVAKDPLLDISLTDSQELWLIQWPIHELQVSDFNGKEVTLKTDHDGMSGTFENSTGKEIYEPTFANISHLGNLNLSNPSHVIAFQKAKKNINKGIQEFSKFLYINDCCSLPGKSYDVVSCAAQDPDATVFLASKSETKVVGKISRRVCLVHYPEPSELQKRGYGGNFSLSCQRSEGSYRKSLSRYSGTPLRRGSIMGSAASHGTLNSGNDFGERSIGLSQRSKKKGRESGKEPSETTAMSAEHSSHASGVGSQSKSLSSQGEKSSKKKKIKVEE